jgi:hypothetical protein
MSVASKAQSNLFDGRDNLLYLESKPKQYNFDRTSLCFPDGKY